MNKEGREREEVINSRVGVFTVRTGDVNVVNKLRFLFTKELSRLYAAAEALHHYV